jgi:hypothetical protein
LKIRTRVLAGVATLALAGGAVAMAAPAGATAPPPFDVTNAVATCNTVTGSLKFSTPLTLTGPTTGNETVTVKAKLLGCTSPTVVDDTDSALVFAGAASATLVSTGGTGCLGLEGAGTASGTFTTKWTAPKGRKFTPTETVGGKLGTYSQSTISGDQGGTFTVDASQAPFAGSYGQFLIGNDYGTTPISDTVVGDAFKGTGAHNGHNSWINAIGNLDIVQELNLCVGAGIKSLTVGIGGAEIG